MSSDSRWSGGAANRGWQSGSRIAPAADRQAILAYVRDYLADCKRYHLTPAEDMAVTVVYGPADIVRAAYRHATTRGAR